MFDNLAQKLFGAKRAESDSVLSDAGTNTIHGTAVTDSSNGSVMVELSSDVTNPDPIEVDGEMVYEDADISVELPTTQNVKEGDEVLVSVLGNTPMRSPVVTGVVGSGDRIAADASAAREIAEATGQHFWDADDGAHVTEVTREEWEDSTSPNYQSGPNSLWNSLGMLFRDGLNNLMALIAARDSATLTFTGAQSEYDYGRYPMPLGTRAVTSVLADGVPASSFTLMRYGAYAELEVSAPQATQTIEVTYNADSSVEFFYNGETSAEIGPSGMTLVKDYAEGENRSASLDFFAGKTRVYATADTETPGAASQGISMAAGFSADASASVDADSGDGGASVVLSTNHQNQRYYFPVLALYQQGSDNRFYLKTNKVELDYGDTNPHGGSTELTMEQVIAMLTTEEQQLTRQSGAASWSVGQARRCGKIVVVTVNGMKLAAALSSGITSPNVGTIPAGLRPNVLQRVPAALNSTGNFGNVWVAIGASGNIQIRNASPTAIPTTNEISFSCSYVID